jgi:hypothetical protein
MKLGGKDRKLTYSRYPRLSLLGLQPTPSRPLERLQRTDQDPSPRKATCHVRDRLQGRRGYDRSHH